MTMANALKMTGIGGAIFLVIVFAVFFFLSCVILIIMEGVSAMVSNLPFGVSISVELSKRKQTTCGC